MVMYIVPWVTVGHNTLWLFHFQPAIHNASIRGGISKNVKTLLTRVQLTNRHCQQLNQFESESTRRARDITLFHGLHGFTRDTQWMEFES